MNFTPFEERKRRVQLVHHALLVLCDEQDHSSKELFDRPDNATSKSENNTYARANLAWQQKVLHTLFNLGLIVKTGAHGPTRRYKLAQGASLDPYFSDEGAAALIWESGTTMLDERASVPPPAASEATLADDATAPPEPESEPAVEPAPMSVDPSQALLGKLLNVLEGMADRLTKIEERIASPPPDYVRDNPETVGLAARLLFTETLNETIGPRLSVIEEHLAKPSNVSALAPPLEAIGKQLLDVDTAMKTLQSDMTKQVNRTQDVATKQVVDKKRYEDFCDRINDLCAGCEIVLRETSKLVVSIRDLGNKPPPPNLEALIDYATDKKAGGRR